MKSTHDYRGLRFERPTHPAVYRPIAIGLALGLFTLLWAIIPHSALYWLLLPLLALAVWTATYGWRQAVGSLHNLLHRLEQL